MTMAGIQVPDETQRMVRAWHGEAGEAWLSALPETVRRLAARWGLSVGPPLMGGSVSLVLMATRAGAVPAGERQAVLKVPFLDEENREEADALRHYGGDGAVRLYAHDEESGALLLERLEPGTPLREHPDASAALAIACALLRRLWRAPAPGHRFRSARAEAAAWAAKLDAARAGGDPRLPSDLLREAADLAHVLSREVGADAGAGAGDVGGVDGLRASAVPASSQPWQSSQASQQPRQWPSAGEGETRREPPHAQSGPEDVVVNRDAHLGNIIAARREPWLLIDPKPLVGEPAFDAGFLVLDRLAQLAQRAQLAQVEQIAQRDRLDRGDRLDAAGAATPDAREAQAETRARERAQAQAIVSAIAAHLDLAPARVRAWALVRAMENAIWSLEVGDTPEADVAKARALAAIAV